MIYVHALVSPTTRWDVRHSYFCKHRDRTDISEAPPFTTKKTSRCLCGNCSSHRKPDTIPFSCNCTCARHHRGLNLLLANRQIFVEAADIFYAKNTFCFDNGYLLVGFFSFLRPRFKILIRHISLLGPAPSDSASSLIPYGKKKENYGMKLWNALLSCSALQTLEIRHDYVEKWAPQIVQLREGREIKITMASCNNIIPQHLSFPKLNDVLIKVEEPVIETDDCEAMRLNAENFYRIAAHCRQAARVELKVILKESPKRITVDLSPFDVTIYGPNFLETRKVVLWGLPNTTSMRIKLAKEERKDNEQRIAKGLLTRQEEQLRDEMKEAARTKKLAADLVLRKIRESEKELRGLEEKKKQEAERLRLEQKEVNAEDVDATANLNKKILEEERKEERRKERKKIAKG